MSESSQPINLDNDGFLQASGLAPYVESIVSHILSSSGHVGKVIAIEGGHGSGKTAVLNGIATRLSADSAAVQIDVSRSPDSEPLLAQLLIGLREKFVRQTAWYAKPLRLFRLAVSVTRLRRRTSAVLRNIGRVCVYLLISWYVALAVLYLHPRETLRLVVEAYQPKSSGGTQSIATGTAQNRARSDTLFEALLQIAGPGLMLVICLVLLHQIEALVPLPSQEAFTSGFGLQAFRQRLAFDTQACEELSMTARRLASGRRICIMVDGMDQCEAVRTAETMSLLRWLSRHCSYPLTIVVGVDRPHVTAAALVANRDFFEYVVRLFAGSSQAESEFVFGDTLNTSPVREDLVSSSLEVAHDFIEKFFDLTVVLPRVNGSRINGLLFGKPIPHGSDLKHSEMVFTEEHCLTNVEMATIVFEGNIGKVCRFMDELQIVWRAVCQRNVGLTEDDELTPEQAGKVLLALRRWPQLRHVLYRRPTLLGEIEAIVSGESAVCDLSKDPVLQSWVTISALRGLLRFGVAPKNADDSVWARLTTLKDRERFSVSRADVRGVLFT